MRRNSGKLLFIIILFLLIDIIVYYFYWNQFSQFVPRSVPQNKTIKPTVFNLESELEPAHIYEPINCVPTKKIFVSTHLCIYNGTRDAFISALILKYGTFEQETVGNTSIFFLLHKLHYPTYNAFCISNQLQNSS